MAQPGEDEVIQFMAQVLYREWGRRFTIIHKYLKAIFYYEHSTKHGDENYLWTLLGLSEALKKAGLFKEAAEVAEKCMDIDPKHLGANFTRMGALFDIAEFGLSLVCAHRGVRRRTNFRAGVLLANETLEDCVGANVPRKQMTNLQPWIKKLSNHRQKLLEQLRVEEQEFAGIGEEVLRFQVNDPDSKLRHHRKRMDRLIAAIYLGSSVADKIFLDSLLQNPALPSANKTSTAELTAILHKDLPRLQRQQEALRMRRPIYAIIAHAKACITRGLQAIMNRELELKRCLIMQNAKFMLRRLHEARLCRDYPLFFKLVEQAKGSFESHSRRLFPERDRYLDALSRMVARAYIDPRDVCRYSNEEDRNARVRKQLGIRNRKLPRDSDLAWIPTLNVQRAFDTFRERLALASRPLEILWSFHELCKLYTEIRRYDLGRFYAKKTRDLSVEAGYDDWALNAIHILIRVELAQQNHAEAKDAAISALDFARKLKVDFLVDFYQRVIEYIESPQFGRHGDEDSIVARERFIVNLMPLDMRPKMELLVRKIESVPAKRRLSVMPGCKPKNQKTGLPRKLKTIVPQPPISFQREATQALLKKFTPTKTCLGLVDFNEYE